MSVSLSLPPSGRDFLVYQRVVTENASTRVVAGEFEISQTRVRQIVNRVNQWLSATLPKIDPDIDDAARIRVGQHIAADRMEYLYCHAMEEWNKSKQLKFAGLLIRISAAQAKIPAFPGTIAALAADVIEGPLPEEEPDRSRDLVPRVPPGNAVSRASALADPTTRQEPRGSGLPGGSLETRAENPSVRDCSPAPAAEAQKAAEPRQVSVATPAASVSSGKLPPSANHARKAFLAPAQSTDTTGDELPVTELKITPQQLGFSTKRLSRRERRRLRHKLGA